LAVAAFLAFSACTEARDRPIGEGVHPVGWSTPESPAFHGTWLAANGDDLRRCQACHGADYQGGAVGVGCGATGCHTADDGPEACGTCHGADPIGHPDAARPATGAHANHDLTDGDAGADRLCGECHVVPENVGDEGHIGDDAPGPDVVFSGLAIPPDAAAPIWHPGEKQCSGTYCHVTDAPTWDGPELECSGCHAAPPDTHARFADRATEEDCATCHADPTAPDGVTHVNGAVDLALPEGCGTCHGDEETGAPPPALGGATNADEPGVGAHQRHLDPNLDDRIAPVVACDSCHVVPTESDVLADGHVDAEAPADVTLPEGATYDPVERTCVVWCHGNRAPGPAFTDDSGDARACDACHDAPPANHVRFARVAADEGSCATCHPGPPAETHVNGTIDFALPEGCDTCHGSGDQGGPPPSLEGDNDPFDPRVGAHARHLDGSLPDRIGPTVACETCHAAPAEVLADGHLDDEAPAEVSITLPASWSNFPNGSGYDPADHTCQTSCHWNNDPGPRWNDASGQQRECGACHTMPPAETRDGSPHPAAGPDLSDCIVCHTFSPETHIDGEMTP